jgi:hypothetical protein
LIRVPPVLPELNTFRATFICCVAAVAVTACAARNRAPHMPAKAEQRAHQYARRADREFAGGERELALELATHALVVRLAACGFECPEVAASFVQLGDLRQASGQPDWAVQLYARALEILEPHSRTHGEWVTAVEQRLAAACSLTEPPPATCVRE